MGWTLLKQFNACWKEEEIIGKFFVGLRKQEVKKK
jgi:hypothetical protein